MTESIGPFELGVSVRAVPGATVWEALDPEGAPVLLQVSFLRADRAGQWQGEIQRIQAATRALADDCAAGLRAHGHVASGSRVAVYWSLNWVTPKWVEPPENEQTWIEQAQSLTGKLATRHRVGARAPLLCEQTLVWTESGVDWFGVPVAVAPRWTAAGAPPPRSAPNERGAPTEGGDLWRLATALNSLAIDLSLPAEWVDWLAELESGAVTSAEAAVVVMPSRRPRRPPRSNSLVSMRWGPPGDNGAVPETTGADSAPGPAQSTPEAMRTPQVRAPSLLDFKTAAERALTALAESAEPEEEVFDEPPTEEHEISFFREELVREEEQRRAINQGIAQPLRSGDDRFSFESPRPPVAQTARPHAAVVAPRLQKEPAPFIASRLRLPRAVWAALASVFVLSIMAFAIQEARRPHLALAHEGQTVHLDSDPPGARVLSMRDGLELGAAPLDFLMPKGTRSRVLVVLDHHLPVAVTLPEEGTVTVRLTAADRAHACKVALPSQQPLQVYPGGKPVSGALYLPFGAAVVRTAPGSTESGARIVRCPALGGETAGPLSMSTPLASHLVRITEPEGGVVFVDRVALGGVPVETATDRAFVRIEVTRMGHPTVRWVPTDRNVEVRMPVDPRPLEEALPPPERPEPDPGRPPARPTDAISHR